MEKGISILFVCLGNICRSPAAEEILRVQARARGIAGLHVESAGTGHWHVGQLPDRRMRAAAARRGLELTSRAQQIDPSHMEAFDYILAADRGILNHLEEMAGERHAAKLGLMTRFSKSSPNAEIPDPYYDNARGFELVLDMLEEACSGFLDYLSRGKV